MEKTNTRKSIDQEINIKTKARRMEIGKETHIRRKRSDERVSFK